MGGAGRRDASPGGSGSSPDHRPALDGQQHGPNPRRRSPKGVLMELPLPATRPDRASSCGYPAIRSRVRHPRRRPIACSYSGSLVEGVVVESAGINRHEGGDGNALHRRTSDPRWPRVMRWRPARAQRAACTPAVTTKKNRCWESGPARISARRTAMRHPTSSIVNAGSVPQPGEGR
jgi:hypothetical protein